jgi:Domain of unknown function (DUF1818)
MTRQLKSGAGWRLGWDSDTTTFQALVGTDDWAIELTAPEWADFCRLTLQLADTLEQMQSELMDEERISCEAESDLIWMEAEGLPQSYQLRLIVLTGRRAEAAWSPVSVPGLVQAIQTLPVF